MICLQRFVLPKLMLALGLHVHNVAIVCGVTDRQVGTWTRDGIPVKHYLKLTSYYTDLMIATKVFEVFDEDATTVLDVVTPETYCGLMRTHNLRHLIRTLDKDTQGRPFMRYTHFPNETNTCLITAVSSWKSQTEI